MVRVVRRVPPAVKRAAVIAAGPNKSVGVDSDASIELVSDSGEEADIEPLKELPRGGFAGVYDSKCISNASKCHEHAMKIHENAKKNHENL